MARIEADPTEPTCAFGKGLSEAGRVNALPEVPSGESARPRLVLSSSEKEGQQEGLIRQRGTAGSQVAHHQATDSVIVTVGQRSGTVTVGPGWPLHASVISPSLVLLPPLRLPQHGLPSVVTPISGDSHGITLRAPPSQGPGLPRAPQPPGPGKGCPLGRGVHWPWLSSTQRAVCLFSQLLMRLCP